MTQIAANVMVACGGSGSKTVRQVVQLMDQDPRWKREMPESLYIVLVDTDEGDLNNNAATIKDLCPDLWVAKVWVTEGFSHAGQMVSDFVESMLALDSEEERASATQRFSEHWWCKNVDADSPQDLEPELLGNFEAGEKGAGQVPMFSYLATWRNLEASSGRKSVEAAIAELVPALKRRRANLDGGTGKHPSEDFNIFLIGSVAGGTGRGCSQLIAFKLKQVFEAEMGEAPQISGYFYDASVFTSKSGNDDLARQNAQRFNAATGWSEYSMWFEAARDVHHPGFALPSRIGIHDPVSDVVSTKAANSAEQMRDGMGRRVPFNSISVICNASEVLETFSDVDIYKMLATSLYVRLTQSSIDSAVCNTQRKIFSVGSARVEVKLNDIRDYFREYGIQHLEEQCLGIDDVSVAAASGFVLQELGIENLLEEIAPRLGNKEREASPVSVFDFFRKSAPESQLRNKLRDVDELMRLQDVEQATDALKQALSDSYRNTDINKRVVLDLYTESVANAAQQDFDKWLIAFQEGFMQKSLGEHGSVDSLIEACEQAQKLITERFTALRENALGMNNVTGRARCPDLLGALENAAKSGGFLGFGDKFSEEEIDTFNASGHQYLCFQAAQILGEAYRHEASPVAKVLDFLESLAAQAQQLKSTLVDIFSARDRKDLRGEARSLFCTEQEDSTSLPSLENVISSDIDDPQFNIVRDIKPLYPSSEEIVIEANDFKEKVLAILKPNPDAKEQSAWSTKSNLEDSLSFISLKIVDGEHEHYVDDFFTLSNVLGQLEEAWGRFLSVEAGKGDDRWNELSRKVSRYFGVNPRRTSTGQGVRVTFIDDDLKALGEGSPLLLSIAAAAARACRPYWIKKGGSATRFTLVVPKWVQDPEAWGRYVSNNSNVSGSTQKNICSVIGDKKPDQGGSVDQFERNQFLLAVYVVDEVDSFDDVTSLGEYTQNPVLLNSLRNAERQDCLMPFQDKSNFWENYGGSGFTSPIYVTRPEYRVYRWRPWLPKEQRDEELQAYEGAREASPLQKFTMPIVYALFGPGRFLEWALGRERAMGVAKDWETPSCLASGDLHGGALLVEGNAKRITLSRRPVEYDGNGGARDSEAEVSVGFTLCQRVTRLMPVLDGSESVPNEGADSEAQVRILRKALVKEYDTFMEHAAEAHGFSSASGAHQYQQMLDGLRAECVAMRDGLDEKDEDREFWREMLKNLS